MKQLIGIIFLFGLVNAQMHGEPSQYTKNLETAFPGFEMPATWLKNHSPVRIIGNLYGVGGHDLSVYLITSSDGHILINTGAEGSIVDIGSNIDLLGFKLKDVKVLLTMQSHFDHTADLAHIKELVGAKMYATQQDAPVLEDGGVSDPHFGGLATFRPVTVDKIIRDGEVIELGDTRLTVHYHPGHTEGSSSYSMTVVEGGQTYNVLIANMGTINPGKQLLIDPTYPGVADDFSETYKRQKMMDIDIWVAAHKSQYNFFEKYVAGQRYSPETFVDPEGFLDAIEVLEVQYIKQLNAELTQRITH